MLYRTFGKTGERVSSLGFGCMRLPIIAKDSTKIDEKEAVKMVRYAIDQGLNYIDTAYPYHGNGSKDGGSSELFVAKCLKDGYRQRVKLATKLPSWLINSREDMDYYLNRQLERLETESIDFYLVHAINQEYWDNLTALGIFEFLDQAIADGRIKYAGFSFHDRLELFKTVVDAYDWSFCQVQLNYIDEGYQAGREGMEYAANKGLGIVIMEPLRGGNLVNNIPEEVVQLFEGATTKHTPAQWAFRWLYNDPQVHVVLSGMSTMQQTIENVDTAGTASVGCMNEEEIEIMNRVKKIFRDRIQVDCTACEYCLPCPVGVNIPWNFSRYNEYHLFDSSVIKERNIRQYQEVDEKQKAVSCIECGACESHCPQNIRIREELKKVEALLG